MFTIPPATVRRGCALAAAVAAGGLLAGCGTVTAGSTAGSTAAPHAGLTPCGTASLTVAVNTGQASALAGSTYYPVDFTNTSKAACGMSGFPGVSFVSAGGSSGRQIGAAAQQNPAYSTLAVRIPAGGTAHAWLQVAVSSNYPASACKPVSAHWLRITAPQATGAGYVSFSSGACASAATPLLIVMPVRAGKAVHGTTP
ncbi:MAG: DUF4232 domain-containing protein [Streptosporangiaceae bacterium]